MIGSIDVLIQALGQIVYDWRPASDELRWGGDYTRILGYDERAMGTTTSSWTDRVHPDDLAPVMREVEACTQQRRFYDLEYRFRRSDGAYQWMHDRGVPFFGPDGSLERIVGVFSDIGERKRAQQALRDLTRRMVESEESERRNIHRELHDRIGQGLSSLSMSLELVRQQLPPEALALVAGRLDDARALALRVVQDTRDVMADLRPPVLDEFGLLTALRIHVRDFAERTGIEAVLSGREPLPALESVAQTALFRIAQEALVNVAKHADASRVEVTLAASAGGAELSVDDDGKGFDVALAGGAHWGLRTMRERAEAVGAVLRIESRAGRGTRVWVQAPSSAEGS
jgi:two-component system sensor histidine kinase UhpB